MALVDGVWVEEETEAAASVLSLDEEPEWFEEESPEEIRERQELDRYLELHGLESESEVHLNMKPREIGFHSEGDLVMTPDGYTVVPRTTPLASVGTDPLRSAGKLGKLTPEQRRVQRSFRENAKDHATARNYFPPASDDNIEALSDSRHGGGYSIHTDGATGAPIGRPRLGTTDPTAAARLLEERTEQPIAKLRAHLGKGKRPPHWLCVAVAEILTKHTSTDTALATALGYKDRSSIHRLASKARR